jgi:hypothetical protein
MPEQSSFVDILKAEIAQHEAALERNPTWIKLQAARRTLAAYEGPEPKKHRAAAQPKCARCGRHASAHINGFCPRSAGAGEYEPETKA